MQWSVPEHHAALRALDSALREAGRPAGVVVVAPDGAGKSTLARLAAEHWAADHASAHIRWVTGTPTERMVPFGAFGHLVDITDAGKPAALLRTARESLCAGGDDLLIVDDANALDRLSATLVYQLALAGQTRMIVTASAGPHTSPALIALWTDDLMERLDLTDGDGTGGDVTGGDGASGGAAAAASAQVDGYLDELPAQARAVLGYLTVQEPIALADLATLTGADAIRTAESLGAVEVHLRDEPAVAMVFTAHPLFTARARERLTDSDVRRIRTELVPLAAARARDHAGDRLRLALLALDSDSPQQTAVTVAAAAEALRLGDLPLGERLARAALADGGLPARLLLAHSLAWQGRGRDADEVLAAVNPDTLGEADLMAWTLPRAANQFWMLGAPERATAFLRTTRNRLTTAAARTTIDALTATFAMNAGNPQRALEIAGDVLASTAADETAVAWAASTAALCAARTGRLGEVPSLAETASTANHPGLLRFTVGLAQTTRLLMDGEVARAEAVAREFTDFAELQQPGRAIGEVLVAQVLLTRGEFAAAAQLLAPAAAALERTGYSWGPLSLMLLATALARQGELAEAAKVLARAENLHGTKSALFAPELGLARAWRLAAARDDHGAIGAARQAAAMAERAGQSTVALRAWHDAVLLGDGRAVDPLSRLADDVDCAFARLAARHGRALAAGDGPALESVAAELATMGLAAAAQRAAAQAESRPSVDNRVT